MTRKGTGFTTIALPDRITSKLDKMISESRNLYQSRSHIVKIALADFFEKNNGGGNGDNNKS